MFWSKIKFKCRKNLCICGKLLLITVQNKKDYLFRVASKFCNCKIVQGDESKYSRALDSQPMGKTARGKHGQFAAHRQSDSCYRNRSHRSGHLC